MNLAFVTGSLLIHTYHKQGLALPRARMQTSQIRRAKSAGSTSSPKQSFARITRLLLSAVRNAHMCWNAARELFRFHLLQFRQDSSELQVTSMCGAPQYVIRRPHLWIFFRGKLY